MHRFSPLALAAILISSQTQTAANAQAWQCTAPANLSRPVVETPKPSDIRRTPVAGYLLALSWSPEQCRNRPTDPETALQCGGNMGDFGFVLHGLWPESKGSDYPQYCRPAAPLSRKVIAANICMTPSVQLLQHEWTKHGTCMTRRPEAYFGAAKLLYGALQFPDMDRLSREPMTASGLASAFAAINDGLPAGAVAVKTNNRGWLQEVRICLNKKLKPHTCPKFSAGAPGAAEVKAWRGGS